MGQVDPIDLSLRADLHRTRTWPYHMYPTSMAGSSGIPDPFPEGELPWPPFDRKRHIWAYTHYTGQSPWESHPYLPAEQQGRFWLARQGPVGAPVGPPKLTYGLWEKSRHYHPGGSVVASCLGGKAEQGLWNPGHIGVRQNRTGETVIGPPRLNLYTLYPWDQQDGPNFWVAMNYADLPQANQYRYFILFPVYPHNAWETYPCYPDCVPYPPGAHNDFCFNDSFTYEVPCYDRTGTAPSADWRHRTLPTANPKVEPGLRAIIAQDSAEPQLALMPQYYDAGISGVCQTHEPAMELWPWWLIENFIRRHKGRTATTRIPWTDDPQNRGWWVEYSAFVNSWLVHNYNWFWTGCVDGSVIPEVRCWWRWNAWYQGEVKMRHNGDLGVPGFYNFIAGQDSRFGLRFQPRTENCNDVLAHCAGLNTALGDITVPSEDCQDNITNPPCLDATGKYSTFYVPEPPAHVSVPPSRHPIMDIPAYPEVPLIHEIKRTMLDANGNDDQVQYGWAQTAFTTTVPLLTGG